MIYDGIDIAKLNHYASDIDSDDVVLIEPFEFLNDNEGFYTLLSKLNSFELDDIIIGHPLLTMATNWFLSLSQKGCMSVSLIRYRPPLCGRTISAKPRRTKSIL